MNSVYNKQDFFFMGNTRKTYCNKTYISKKHGRDYFKMFFLYINKMKGLDSGGTIEWLCMTSAGNPRISQILHSYPWTIEESMSFE